MTWKTKRLRDLADLCLGKMLDKEKNKGELRFYLANLNVRWGRFDLSDLREMRFEDREVERYGVRAGDIVMCEGGEPGRCAIWRDQRPGMMLQKALHRIRSKPEIDHRFLFYSLVHKGQTQSLDQYFTGATIKHLPGEKLALVEVDYPSLNKQRRIASILSAYDDLIENNTRRIAILEEMARRIYEEWFVRFRFPGHEGVRMVESELGLVPEGWELTSLGAVAENHDRFRRPLSKMEREDFKGPYPYYGAAKIFDYVREYLFDGQFLLLAEDGSVETPDGYPVLQLTDGKFWANNHMHILRGTKRASTEFLYLRLERQPIRGYITGAAQPKLTQAAINRIPLVLPPSNVLREFGAHIQPQFQLRATLIRANTNLRTTRDLLLPKLISGELDVSAMPEPEALAA